MIDAGGYFDWAIQDPGPVGSVNGARNGGKGIIPHSAEGYFRTLEALHDFHWSRALAPPGQKASWGATNLKDGRFVQHYSVWAQTWTSGAGFPNNNFFAFENEGVAGEPLTQPQIDNIIRVGRELSALQGWYPRRPESPTDLTASLYEHTECKRFGSAATACPSGRIPWGIIVPALLAAPEEDDVKPFLALQVGSPNVWLIGFAKPILIGDRKEADSLAAELGPAKIGLSKQTLDQMVVG